MVLAASLPSQRHPQPHQFRFVERVFGIRGRVTAGQQQHVALAQRHVELAYSAPLAPLAQQLADPGP
jgi:hypothetical protein